MARIDKHDPKDGGFRGTLAADWAGSPAPFGFSVDVNGRMVPGDGGGKGIKGILCKPDAAKAGQQVDFMTDGELVEFAGVAGTNYTANTVTGAISSAAASATQVYVGHTLEATRLIVRLSR